MTRPGSPQPYPGDVPPSQRRAQPTFTRRFVDALRRPLEGEVSFRPTVGGPPAIVPVNEGLLQAHLAPGTYSMLATLQNMDGQYSYVSETVTVGRYR